MKKITTIISKMENSPSNVKFTDLCFLCEHFFGKARQSGTSHRVYKTPWQGDPRVNIQKKGQLAKPYQVKQVLKAIKRLQNG